MKQALNQNEAANLSEQIGNVAADILLAVSSKKITPTELERFYLGLLQRSRLILKDAAGILRSNHASQISSVFILYRALLDDFIRLFSVHFSSDAEEEVVRLGAEAHKHRIQMIEESIRLNVKYYQGEHTTLGQPNILDIEKTRLTNEPEMDKYFKDKKSFKFKSPTQIAQIFKTMYIDPSAKGNAHSYILYKFLSQYVHYSNVTYTLERDKGARILEIGQIEEILFYCYKAVMLQANVFATSHNISWNDRGLEKHFRERVI